MDSIGFDFDAVCRHVGRLYLTSCREQDRIQGVYETRIRQLEASLLQEQKSRAELEARLTRPPVNE